MPWLPFLLILLPANIMTMVIMPFVRNANTFPKAKPVFGTHGIFRYRYGVSGHRGTMAANNKALCQFLGYSQEELRGLTFSN